MLINSRGVDRFFFVTAYEGLVSFSHEMAEFHWAQYEASRPVKLDCELKTMSLKCGPPALYLMPCGPGGVQSQAAGIFVVEGANVLMGSAIFNKETPTWWNFTKYLDR